MRKVMDMVLCIALLAVSTAAFALWWMLDERAARRARALGKLSRLARAGRYAGVPFEALTPYIEHCLACGVGAEDIRAVLEKANTMED